MDELVDIGIGGQLVRSFFGKTDELIEETLMVEAY